MFLRGELARLSGDTAGAIRQLQQVIAAVPQLDDTYYSLGLAYQQSGRSKEANRMLAIYRERKSLRQRIDEVRIALGGRPNDTALQKELADLQIRARDYQAALDTLEAANHTVPDDIEVRAKIGSLKKRLGQSLPGS
jgi:Flp pilus assembly protein TadD